MINKECKAGVPIAVCLFFLCKPRFTYYISEIFFDCKAPLLVFSESAEYDADITSVQTEFHTKGDFTMGAVFTITLFLPLMIPMFVLDKIGIDVYGILERLITWIVAWVEANPDKAFEIGKALESLMGMLVNVVDKLNIFQI